MAKPKKGSEDDDLLRAALEDFRLCEDAENDNRTSALEDIQFSRLGIQWPADVARQRQIEGRPCLTINKLPTFIRQVVNDARQNKPSIKVHAADSGADPATAELMNGLIRNIEYTSNADTAYDTATECAVTGGFGYIRVGMDYAYDDAFDMDICIKRVSNPFSVYGDPNSREADSSDWDKAFVVDQMTKEQFEAQWGDKAQVDWDDSVWNEVGTSWRDGNTTTVAEWWTREETERPIVLLSDGSIHDLEDMQSDDMQFLLQAGQVQVVRQRTAKSCKVTQRFMSGAEILETREWPGRYIPIIPVYGDEFDVEGKRYFRSLIHNAIDAQRMFNYWRTASTELVALAPKVPFIGEEGAFDVDIQRWNTANTKSHPFLEYSKGKQPPQRQPLDMGTAAGALQEALNASDDIKSIIGLYDASLGARSNETSGRAIMARQREGDVSTFHFIDNMARAIRHTGRILIDLIPKVYSGERIIRVIGEDGTQEAKPINQQYQQKDPKTGQPMQQPVMGPNGQPVQDQAGNPLMQPIMAIHDLTAGKYDLTVTTGPSFTSRREEAAASMTEMVRAFPAAAPIIVPELAKNLDWPGADKIAEKMQAAADGQVPPQAQQQMEQGKKQIEQMATQLQQLQQENQQLKADKSDKIAEIQSDETVQLRKIESEERVSNRKIVADQNAAFYKAQASVAAAAAKPQPNPRQNA
ncbi:hypothetical protein FJ973_29690 [Mesorhizobium sp. B2-1-3]|uniref:portal protein n=1 Tax=Mesorhizobium sp. B2-1-3 TaxID=2589972 RepID=UPI00112E60E2|nr:portal protein [Mesorhizobium sp. B2-1-3]TPN03818.1 hypothetical protein FJ973_29690 [Mesorhizobium sp. B2-1-3]